MLDVVSFYMEEDITSAHSKERMDVKDAARKILYRELYDKEYMYQMSGDSQMDVLPEEGPLDDVKPFDPSAGPTKSYIPPTEVDADSNMPYGSTLGQPLG